MMEKLDLQACCGCGECAALCPKGAISVQADAHGFYKAVVDETRCVLCGLCTQECAVTRAEALKAPHLKVYGAQNTSRETRLASSSGGVFSSLAMYVLRLGGSVYGVSGEHNDIRHVRITDISDLPPLLRSKYVQSRLSPMLYGQIEEDLACGRFVLFTGTPCQCAGVRNYVQKKKLPDEKLYIADIICYGVPSPRVFSDYIAHCEKKAKKKIDVHIFRAKDKGWGVRHEINVFSDGTCDGNSFLSQLHNKIFYTRYALNEACFACRFADTRRVSDITMADFWGIKQSHPEKTDKSGVSVILVNTPQGEKLICATDDLSLFCAAVEDLRQPNLSHAQKRPKAYDAFWDTYNSMGFWPTMQKYCEAGVLRQIGRWITKPIPISCKRAIKQWLKRH